MAVYLIFYLAFYLAYLLAFYLAYLLALSSISSGILSGISSDILSDILSGILSGISSDILSDIFFHILPVEVRQCPLLLQSTLCPNWGQDACDARHVPSPRMLAGCWLDRSRQPDHHGLIPARIWDATLFNVKTA